MKDRWKDQLAPQMTPEQVRAFRLDRLSGDRRAAHLAAIDLLDGSHPFDPHAALCVLRTAYPRMFSAIASS